MSASSTPTVSEEVWVIDTSSILEVCRDKVPKARRAACFALLTKLAQEGKLIFPLQVIGEMKRFGPAQRGEPHPPLDWAKTVQGVAESNPEYDTVKGVLAQVPDVLDSEKPTNVDEADPYVLARALELQAAGRRVRVITEDTRNKPNKMALSTAAGMLGLASVTLVPFLKSHGVPLG